MKSPLVRVTVAAYTPLPWSASGVAVVLNPLKLPAMCTPSSDTVSLLKSTWKVTSTGVGHAAHEAKHTTGRVTSVAGTVKKRLPPLWHSKGTLSSCPHVSPLMNLYWISVPSAMATVTLQTPLPWSVSSVAPGVHPWKLPAMETPTGLTDCCDISTWKVTLVCAAAQRWTSTAKQRVIQNDAIFMV